MKTDSGPRFIKNLYFNIITQKSLRRKMRVRECVLWRERNIYTSGYYMFNILIISGIIKHKTNLRGNQL